MKHSFYRSDHLQDTLEYPSYSDFTFKQNRGNEEKRAAADQKRMR